MRRLLFAALLLAGSCLPGRALEAAEAAAPPAPADTPGPTLDTAAAWKRLSTENGIAYTLLSLAIAAIVAEFWLLMAASNKRELALSKQAEDHSKEMAAKEAAQTAERNEWQSSYSILQESRLSLMREVLSAIHSSTSVMNATQTSINERTQTAAELAAQVSSLVSAIRDLRSNTGSDISELRTAVRETSTQVAKLSTIVAQAG